MVIEESNQRIYNDSIGLIISWLLLLDNEEKRIMVDEGSWGNLPLPRLDQQRSQPAVYQLHLVQDLRFSYNYMYSIRIRMIILNHVCIVLINTSPYLYIVIHCIRINIRYQEKLPCTDSVGRWHRGFHPIWMSRWQYWICSDEVRCVGCNPIVSYSSFQCTAMSWSVKERKLRLSALTKCASRNIIFALGLWPNLRVEKFSP